MVATLPNATPQLCKTYLFEIYRFILNQWSQLPFLYIWFILAPVDILSKKSDHDLKPLGRTSVLTSLYKRNTYNPITPFLENISKKGAFWADISKGLRKEIQCLLYAFFIWYRSNVKKHYGKMLSSL